MNKCLFLILVVGLSLIGCSGSKKPAERKIDRKIIGLEMKFGKDAARADLWNEAIFRWEKVVNEDPDNFEAVNNLAVAYESVGDYDKAEKLYRRALELNEDNPDVRENYKKFLSFYKRHQRQIQREKEKKLTAAPEKEKIP